MQSIRANYPKNIEEVRQEPPQPVEPQEEIKPQSKDIQIPKLEQSLVNEKENVVIDKSERKESQIENQTTKPEEVDKAAIEKEDKELQEELKEKQESETEKSKAEKKTDDILAKLEKHKEEQKNLIQQQKQLLEEIKKETKELKELKDKEQDELRMKAANQIVEIAKKAIESLGPKTNDLNNKVVNNENVEKKQENTNLETKQNNMISDLQKLVNETNARIINENKNNKINEDSEKLSNNNITEAKREEKQAVEDTVIAKTDTKLEKIKTFDDNNSKIITGNMVPLPILVNNSRQNIPSNAYGEQKEENKDKTKIISQTIKDVNKINNIESAVRKEETEVEPKRIESLNEVNNNVQQQKSENKEAVKEIPLTDDKLSLTDVKEEKDEKKKVEIAVTEKVEAKVGRDILAERNEFSKPADNSERVKRDAIENTIINDNDNCEVTSKATIKTQEENNLFPNKMRNEIENELFDHIKAKSRINIDEIQKINKNTENIRLAENVVIKIGRDILADGKYKSDAEPKEIETLDNTVISDTKNCDGRTKENTKNIPSNNFIVNLPQDKSRLLQYSKTNVASDIKLSNDIFKIGGINLRKRK